MLLKVKMTKSTISVGEEIGIEVVSRDSLYRSNISFTGPDLLPYTMAHRICFPL